MSMGELRLGFGLAGSSSFVRSYEPRFALDNNHSNHMQQLSQFESVEQR